MDAFSIPATLRAIPQWVCWSWVERPDPRTGELKRTKMPLQARTGQAASSTDSRTWTDFETARQAYRPAGWTGAGFVFTVGGGLVGIDLDHCLQRGELSERAAQIVRQLDSYTEVTPSGDGLHIICAGTLPGPQRHRKEAGFAIELYPEKRFFTMTGQHWPGTPADIVTRFHELTALYAELFPVDALSPEAMPALARAPLADCAILRIICGARNGDKFRRLWRGDTTGYVSESEADLALLAMLRFYTDDPAQLDRLFSGSALYDAKWRQRPDYRARSIARVLARPGGAQFQGGRV